MNPSNPSRSHRTLGVVWSWLAFPALALALSLGCGGKKVEPNAPPTLTGYTPTLGEASSQVVVYGTGLGEGLSSVTFSGIPINLNYVTIGLITASPDPNVNNTSVSFAVPTNATTGPIVIVTSAGSITTPDFIVIPVLGSVSPASGSLAAGTTVTVDGYGLMGITQVQFGGVTATLTSQTPNQIVMTLPAGAPQGATQITFVVNGAYNLPNLQAPFTVNP